MIESADGGPSKWNRGSSNWPVAGGWLCIALYSFFAVHRFALGAAEIGLALAYGADEFLARTKPSRWRLNSIRVLSVGVLIAVFWPR
jgi:hypothetical protein